MTRGQYEAWKEEKPRGIKTRRGDIMVSYNGEEGSRARPLGCLL